MKLAKDCIANNLFVLFNISLTSEIFPNKLKISKILLLFKKDQNCNAQIIDQLCYSQILIKLLRTNPKTKKLNF